MEDKYVVIPGQTDLNRGDQALVWESVRLSKEAGLTGKYYLLTSGETEDEIYKQSRQSIGVGYDFIRPVLPHPGRGAIKEGHGHFYSKKQLFSWGVNATLDTIKTSLLLSRRISEIGKSIIQKDRAHAFDVISQTKAVIVKGGGFLHSYGGITSTYQVYFSVYHILLAIKLGKPVIILPNSFGPFKGPIVPQIFKRALKDTTIITSRESTSSHELSKLLNREIPVYPDLGFFIGSSSENFSKNYLISKGIPLGTKPCVGITVRPYRFPQSHNPTVEYKNYISTVAEFVCWLDREGYHPILFAHTLGPSHHEDDTLAIKDILTWIQGLNVEYSYLEDDSLNCMDLKSLYGQLDFMVGTRFHSVIFAISQGVPSLAIGYGGNKSKGIMNDMNIGEFVMPIEGLTFEGLKSKFQLLTENFLKVKEDSFFYMEKAFSERENLKKLIQMKLS